MSTTIAKKLPVVARPARAAVSPPGLHGTPSLPGLPGLVSLVGLLGLVGLAAAGCDNARDWHPANVDGQSADPATCTACHGNTDNSAPPQAVGGAVANTDQGVGAHQAHLSKAGVACATCHIVPTAVHDPGHIDDDDGLAEVTFSGLALANGATPTWDVGTATCSATWCHGGGLKETSRGKIAAPMWYSVDGTVKTCGACHGSPPGAPHPQKSDCSQCHATTVFSGNVLISGGTHLDGEVEVVLAAHVGCDGCHGAPPAAPHPQVQLCAGCHSATVAADGALVDGGPHRNGAVDVVLGADAPCTGCHGAPPTEKHPKFNKCELCHATTVEAGPALIEGGTHRNGKVDFALATTDCNACHSAPPAWPHPQMKLCGRCHSETVDADGAIIPGGAHVNLKIDMQLPTECNACHGSADSPAPPPDHNGETDPTLPTVGAHAAHLSPSNYRGVGFECDTCHKLPESVDAEGHLDGTLHTVSFPGEPARWNGAVPAYDPKTQTCSNSYCHGWTTPGGTLPKPKWTDQDLTCDGCHSTPPADTFHAKIGSSLAGCEGCHPETISAGALDLQGGKHINGKVEVQL